MNSLQYAISMEYDGEKYYAKQAELHKGTSLEPLFTHLANDERRHAHIIEDKFGGLPYELSADSRITEFKNVFDGIPDYESEIQKMPKQLELYQEALLREKESIDLYKKMGAESINDKDKQLFAFLVGQETLHYNFFESLITLVSRPEEWVESAEFGLRKEY